MKSAHANLRGCANYLIQLFYKTDKRYSCTRSKIGKLLSILAFKYACKGIKLFEETIDRWPNCGTFIKETRFLVPVDVYVRDIDAVNPDGKKMIAGVELNHNACIPEFHQNISGLLPNLKRDIEDVFFYFGAYSQVDLSDELNPIVEYGRVCRPDGSVDLNEIAHLDKNLFPNNVVEYIFKR